jgi:hypothetical protein
VLQGDPPLRHGGPQAIPEKALLPAVETVPLVTAVCSRLYSRNARAAEQVILGRSACTSHIPHCCGELHHNELNYYGEREYLCGTGSAQGAPATRETSGKPLNDQTR